MFWMALGLALFKWFCEEPDDFMVKALWAALFVGILLLLLNYHRG